MRHRKLILDEGHKSRRTVADALEVLRHVALFDGRNRAEIKVGELLLPTDQIVGLVLVVFDDPTHDKGYVVSLPTSAQFLGIRRGSLQPEHFDIWQLDEAVVGGNANVLLADGTELRAVEVIPARLPLDPSELDWRIVHHTVSIIGAEQRCYRNLRHCFPLSQQPMVPDLFVLDCGTLTGLNISPLKELAWKIAERDSTLKKLSQQKIANALCDFGMRIPKPRSRRR